MKAETSGSSQDEKQNRNVDNGHLRNVFHGPVSHLWLSLPVQSYEKKTKLEVFLSQLNMSQQPVQYRVMF